MSTVTLFPNGTAATYGRVEVSAGTAHDALVTSGGEYVSVTNWGWPAPSYILLDMQTFAMPAGGVVTNITNYGYISGATIGGGPGPYAYMWRYGSNARTKTAATSGSWVTYTTPDSDNAGVPPSTQADIDSYQLYIYCEPVDSLLYVQQAYIIVTYVGLPTIGTVSAPSAGTKYTATQTATWTFTKDAASPAGQAKYHMRVFNTAQYSIGGFDPATSPAFYDSGVVVSSTQSATVNYLMPGTYRCYVRAATTNGGQDQWAAWKNSPTFTIQLATIKIWNGSSYFDGPVKIWDGSAWQEGHNVKVWTGTDWVCAVNGCIPSNRDGTITTTWSPWDAVAIPKTERFVFAIASWEAWTATAAGVTLRYATITQSWGTWTATANGARSTTATITQSWGIWTTSVVGVVQHPAVVASNWGTWTGTGIAYVGGTAIITSSWGTWVSNVNAVASPRILATVNSSWGTWTATATGIRERPATILTRWMYSWYWTATPTTTRFISISTNWGTWAAESHGNARPMPRRLESGVDRLYEDGTLRVLEQWEYFDDHGAWTPAALSGLAVSLNAVDYTNGATWANPGSADDTPIYSTPLPVRVDNAINGLPVVRFKTNEGRVRLYSTGVNTDWTLVYVGRMTPGATNWIGRIVNGIYTPANLLIGFWNGFQDVAYDNGFAAPNTQTGVTSDLKMYSADGATGQSGRFFSNGVLMGSLDTPAGFSGTFAISGYDPTGAAETCDCEVALAYQWNRKLSDAERQQVEAYMRTRFALT